MGRANWHGVTLDTYAGSAWFESQPENRYPDWLFLQLDWASTISFWILGIRHSVIVLLFDTIQISYYYVAYFTVWCLGIRIIANVDINTCPEGLPQNVTNILLSNSMAICSVLPKLIGFCFRRIQANELLIIVFLFSHKRRAKFPS
jgi:hypothetical protein